MSQQQIPILSKYKVKAPRKKPNPKTFAQCRISLETHEAAMLLAKWAFEAKQIPSPTVSALTKASLITMINWYSAMLKQNKEVMEVEKKRRELQALAPSSVPYINLNNPNLKFKLERKGFYRIY